MILESVKNAPKEATKQVSLLKKRGEGFLKGEKRPIAASFRQVEWAVYQCQSQKWKRREEVVSGMVLKARKDLTAAIKLSI